MKNDFAEDLCACMLYAQVSGCTKLAQVVSVSGEIVPESGESRAVVPLDLSVCLLMVQRGS